MKKYAVFLVAIMFVMLFSLNAFAEDKGTVYADKVEIASNETTIVPINVKNNPGLMGFKISVAYNTEQIDVISVSRGDITKKGSFITNFGVKEGSFDVIWNHTEQVEGDASLFVFAIELKNEKVKNATIELKYSPEDTFNSKMEDVPLDCKNVEVVQVEEKKTTQISTENKGAYANDSAQPQTDQLIAAVKAALNESKNNSVYEAAKDQKFIDKVNEKLSDIVGKKKNYVSNYSELISKYEAAYETEFYEKLTNESNTEDVKNAVVQSLEKFGVSSASEIPEDKQEKFVKDVEKNLRQKDKTIPTFSKDVDTQEAMKLIKQAYGMACDGVPEEVEVTNNNSGNVWTVLVIIFCACTVSAAVVFAIIKTKKRKKQEETN